MASTSIVLRTCGLTFYLILQVYATVNNSSQLFIRSLKVCSLSCDENRCKYLLNVTGSEFLGHYPWRLTSEEGAKGGSCEVIYPNYELKEIETAQWFSKVEVLVPKNDGKIYFCLHNTGGNSPFGGQWVHQGTEHFLEPKNDVASQKYEEYSESTEKSTQDINENSQQETQETKNDWIDLTHDIDVNYLPSVARPAREDRNIEILVDGRFVPIKELDNTVFTDDREIIQENSVESYLRDKKYVNNIEFDDGSDPFNNEVIYVPNTFESQNLFSDTVNKSDNMNNIEDIINKNVNDNTNENMNNDIKSDTISGNNIVDSDIKNDDIPSKYIVTNEGIVSEDIVSSNIPYVKIVYNGKVPKEDIVKNEDTSNSLTKDNTATVNSELLNNDIITNEDVENDINENITVEDKVRKRRQLPITEVDFHSVKSADPRPVPLIIEGIRVEASSKEPKIIDDGIPSVLADSSVTLRVYGEGLTPGTVIAFTHDAQQFGQPCKFLLKGEYVVKEGTLSHKTALFHITVPSPITGDRLYVCAKNLKPGNLDPTIDEEKYIHQGTDTWKMLASHNKLLPLWVALTLILTCLMFSALFSGLNLGLMSLDRTELKIISNTGTEQERKYARAIMPVRDHGNYLLCSILLGNVAVNSTFTILLDELTSGLFAVIFSTLAIVLLGEITPQAICSRHGLMVGAKSIMVTKAVMAITAPLSFPVSKLLDYFLGEEIGSVYNRERLKELVKVTTDVNDLDKDEVNIISGALELRKKKVCDVMTKLEDAFMLPITSILDFETMSEIVKSGFSRIPVYEGSRGNIVTVLFIKDLAFVDPDDNTPLRTLCQYYQNTCNFVFEDVTLDIMFKQFKDGHKGHMAFVHRINNEGEGDPFYETIGLVTLEDVIEEMIQAEIVDETDVFTDNRSKRRRNRPQNKLQDFAAFAERHEHQRIHISPQLTLATFQFLSTSVDAFRPDTVSETVLRRLLRQDVIHYIKVKEKTKKDATTYVFQQGKPVDYFVLILEGRVEVTVGRENLVFEAGPFTYFGVQALTQNVGVAESPTPSAMGSLQNINMDAMLRHTFVPDYSVRAITSLHYLTVKRSLYLAAKRATLMEKGNISKGGTNEQFDTEVDKLPSRLNIIELMQIAQNTGREDIHTVNTYAIASDRTNQIPNPESFKLNETTSIPNTFVRPPKLDCTNERHSQRDIDANSCAVCVRNNFWMDKSVLNKSLDDKSDSEHCKKKKATFHTDSTLLTYHNISSTSQNPKDIDYKTINRDIKSNSYKKDELNTRDKWQQGMSSQSEVKRDDYNRDIRRTSDYRYEYSKRDDREQSHKTQSDHAHRECKNQNDCRRKIDYKSESQFDTNRNYIRNDYPVIDYKYECESQEKSNNQELDSIDSFDRFLELERDTIDYEKDIKEEKLAVERRRLETEQIMMFQLSKIIKMLERTHS